MSGKDMRKAFEQEYPPSGQIAYCDKTNTYCRVRSCAVSMPSEVLKLYRQRWATWQKAWLAAVPDAQLREALGTLLKLHDSKCSVAAPWNTSFEEVRQLLATPKQG